MQVYRGLPILTNQSAHPARLVGIWPLDHEASVGEYAAARARGDRRDPRRREDADRRRRHRASTSAPRSRSSSCRRRPPRASASAGSGVYDEEAPAAAHARLAERDPAAAAAVHPNDRRRVVRALELAEAGASLAPGDATASGTGETRHPTAPRRPRRPEDELERRIEARTRAMFDAGRRGGGAARARGGRSRRPRARRSASTRSRRSPREEAIEAIVSRTRRYAAYQRKWMRRIPGLVMRRRRPPAGRDRR